MPLIFPDYFRYRPIYRKKRPPSTPDVPQPDDLRTWPNSASFDTMPLPAAESTAPYFLVFEVTRRLAAGAIADTYGLRFTGPNGAHLAHMRTATNRIFIGGTFTPGGSIPITYYWGKTGQTQPGNGFPAPSTIMAPFREFSLFENGAIRDFSANPAPFTVVGSPTFPAGSNGQAMQCGPGNYVQTMAAKLRGDARNSRHVMALIYTPQTDSAARTICWANWTNEQRGFQLWGSTSYVELYVDDDGVSPYQRWVNRSEFASGWSWIGCSWVAGEATALVQRDQSIEVTGVDFPDSPPAGVIFNSNSPYIIGGTPVAGSYHAGMVETVLELLDVYPLTVDQMAAFDLAWHTNEQFLGIDRTPNTFTPPAVINQELSVEVVYPKVLISGISPSTPIYVSGGRSPAYAISSSLTAGDDIRARGTTPGTISNGQYVRVWDTMSALYSDATRTDLTIGTSTFTYIGTTKAKPGTGGGSGIPSGAATYTVNSLAAGQAIINNQLAPGEILEFADGNYRGQGTLTVSGKDWSAGAKAVIRAANHAYRGPHPSLGGLWVANETTFTTGSKGAEFSGLNIINSKNFVLEGIRMYMGAGLEANWYQFITSVQNAVFRNCRFAGHRPSGYPGGWVPNSGSYTWDAERVPQGFAFKEAVGCLFQNCLIQYVKRGVWIIGGNSTYESCVFTDTAGDLVYMSHANSGQKFIKCVIYRTFPATSAFHCDSLQCTAKVNDASKNQVYELCLIGPGNSGYPHIQGPFLEQDNAAYLGPENVIFKDTVIENRTLNALYLRPARNCQAQNVTMIQNQFSGIDSANRNTLIHNPIINFNASGTSRGGNVINRTAYLSQSVGGSDSVTTSYQLLPAAYAAQLYDFPLYSAGEWRPCLFLNDYCAINATELRRMAPKTTSAIHPNQADIGGHRLFTHYGALP